VVAVGGFGRRWLFPRSDVDLLFVHRPGFEREAEALATRVLYPLWDAGLQVSHAVRTPKDCVREAEQDLKSLTTVLGARLLAGPPDLFEEARDGVVRAVRQKPLRFIDALRRSRDEREQKVGILHHQQEPDLKEALGGIRDLQLGSWLAQALDVGNEVDPGVSAEGLEALATESPTLLASRAVLHGVTQSSSDRLLADLQPAVAAVLGIRAVDGWTPEDRLMRLVLGEARATDLRVESVLEELAARFGSDRARPRFDVNPSKTSLAGSIDGFVTIAQRTGVAAPSSLLPHASRDWPRTRWSLDAVDAFLRLIAAGAAGSRALETMDVLGLMTRLLPEWDRVAGRLQRDPYHRFPVDVHLRATAAEAARLLTDADEPFAVEAVRSVDDPDALLLGALLHDIGKIGKGSHVAAGVEIADRILSRLGMAGATRDRVLFLVREHLLLSNVATRRNLDDEDLILHVAARIRDERRLAMLFLLTIADAVATGPSASTPWRMTLVRDLVAKVSHVFARGSMDRVRAERLEEAGATVRRELSSLPAADVDSFLDGVPTSYLLSVEPSEVAGHLPLVQPAPGLNEVRTSIRAGRSAGTSPWRWPRETGSACSPPLPAP
jgi:[protein-PII] uridylyltransferase